MGSKVFSNDKVYKFYVIDDKGIKSTFTGKVLFTDDSGLVMIRDKFGQERGFRMENILNFREILGENGGRKSF